MAVGGGSADRRAEELASLGDASAGAWAAGAEGERRVAEALAVLPEAWTVLHDRLLAPGLSPVNLDHVVVGPGGVFFVDAKNWRGAITAWEGNLYQHTGARESRKSVSKHQEVAKVHSMAAFMAAETDMRVTPVICLAGHGEAQFGEPQFIRGVWVVAASSVSEWIRARPTVLERDAVERAAVTLMTSFPSTTTDPHLLAAMGAAAAASKPRRRRGPQSSVPARTPQRPRRRGAFSRAIRKLLVLGLMLGTVALAVKVLPAFLLGGIADATSAGQTGAPTATPTAAPTTSAGPRPSAKPTRAPSPTQQRPAAPSPVAVPVSRCGGLTAAQVSKILGHTVQPVASRRGCEWGARLDDPKTTLATLDKQDQYAPHEFQYVTSQSQRRVVYGGAYDRKYQPATALWVAAGQPMSMGKTRVLARTNAHIVVATKTLGVTDEKGRRMALAIAVAANTAR